MLKHGAGTVVGKNEEQAVREMLGRITRSEDLGVREKHFQICSFDTSRRSSEEWAS